MFTFRKQVSRFENHIDALMEKFIFQHKFLGFLMIFIGMPLVTLAAVCLFTILIIFPIILMFGWT